MGNLNPYYNESFVFIVEQEQLRVKPDKPTFHNFQFFCMMNSSQHDQLTIQFRIVYKVLLRWQRKQNSSWSAECFLFRVWPLNPSYISKGWNNIEACKSTRIKEKYALMHSPRCKQYVQHLKLEIAVWDYDRLGPSEVIGSVVLAGGKDLSGQAAP